MSTIPTEVRDALTMIADLEKRLGELKAMLSSAKKGKKVRDPNTPKRAPNAWIRFTLRVEKTLKEAEKGFGRVAESKKFCSLLKAKGEYESWTDEGILAERELWVEAEAVTPVVEMAPCPICNEEVQPNPEKHRDCIRTFALQKAAQGGDALAAVDTWGTIVGVTPTPSRRPSRRSSRPILPVVEEDMSGNTIQMRPGLPLVIEEVIDEV